MYAMVEKCSEYDSKNADNYNEKDEHTLFFLFVHEIGGFGWFWWFVGHIGHIISLLNRLECVIIVWLEYSVKYDAADKMGGFLFIGLFVLSTITVDMV